MPNKEKSLKNRKKIEAKIIKIVTVEDPSGYNAALYHKRFASMSDDQFYAWMLDLQKEKVEIPLYEPPLKVSLQISDLRDAADMLGVKLFEPLRMWDSANQRYFVTANQYAVFEMPVRRLSQSLMHKMSVPDGDRVVNPITGQVTKPDKGASLSLPEIQTMDSKDLHVCLSEMFNVRGGKLQAYAAMRASLEETGSASLREVDTDSPVRSAVSAQSMLRAMHIDGNLVEDGL